MSRRRTFLGAVIALAVTATACTGGTDEAGCERTTDPEWSVARVWNETLLDAIRRDFPAPTVHSRNLFHMSAAMWDAWAAYDPTATGYFVDVEVEGGAADREKTISFAAYGVLAHRYRHAVGADESLAAFDATLTALCLGPGDTAGAEDQVDAAVLLGKQIASIIIKDTLEDGSLETAGYEDEAYMPVNAPMILAERGAGDVADPNRWQPLAFEVARSQNGILLPSNVQTFVGPHWGSVEGFALVPSSDGLPLDPGPPPYLDDPSSHPAFLDAVVEVIRYSSLLDPADGVTIDIGPGVRGNSPLGTNDGGGYGTNPATGEPYAPNIVPRADFGRVVAEFWADGPESETPPGHWNTLANAISDHEDLELRIGGSGPEVDRLEWDVKLYFALNGAVHDAAVAAWGAKGHYDYVRPITMIRYLGSLGQSSDPAGYDPNGLPLEQGLIEVVTEASSAPGERHAHLSEHVGEVTIRSWAGNPGDPETEVGGVDWILATEWVPYQRSTFVTPAFAGYVSGHSTFSRAGAEVLTGFTGSPFFPGGLGEWTIPAGSLEFEAGPATDIVLQWATFYDAADQAGESRLYGGIHVRADDFAGRTMGAECGTAAWELAQKYFDGSAT